MKDPDSSSDRARTETHRHITSQAFLHCLHPNTETEIDVNPMSYRYLEPLREGMINGDLFGGIDSNIFFSFSKRGQGIGKQDISW